MKKAFIRSYGCQMNVYDSERMSDILAADGYQQTDAPEDADLILLNTCHIREKAAERVFSAIGKLREIKDEAARGGRQVLIGITGCVAQAEGAEIVRRAPAVDMVVGPQSYHRLPQLVRAAAGGAVPIETEFEAEAKFAALERSAVGRSGPGRVSAFLTIQEGCDKFCTFCVVPYTRGAETSRPLSAILAEARRLAAAGVRELTLLGQNVNAWRDPEGDGLGLADLLFRLADVPGILRLRYTTSHPRDMDDALISAHRDLPALMPYLHLPVQSGSDRILAAMNRRHTVADYMAILARLREARPEMVLSSDFIVGFPGETETDFAATLALVERVGYASAYAFKYSPRPGTPAAERADQIDEEVKTERLARLQALLLAQQDAFHHSLVGRTVPVLIEKIGRRAGQIGGRTPWLQAIHLQGESDLIGAIVEVTVTDATPTSLSGVLAGPANLDAQRALEAVA